MTTASSKFGFSVSFACLAACGDAPVTSTTLETSTTELSTTEASPTGSNSEGSTSEGSTNDGSTSEGEVPLQCPGSVAGRKNAYFGDLHVHTNYSFDAYFFNELNGPVEAYAFAKGGTAGLPCGDTPDKACRTTALDAPLDF
ncbi:MAG: DUF3604 domain-containing protein, partial [Deltaproteobacteria bacterium]|nr:DUF3604 domain-containing protein [Nannocystaceae bacterium]